MNRTTIVLPEDVKAQAMKRARAQGISFGELIREALARLLREPGGEDEGRRKRRQAIEAMLRFGRRANPGPKDLSSNLDDYLYGDKPIRRGG
jgi:Arc/MetJ family transcription regulator